jgi:spore germination cell wall hydrolase CwlJ-like protein
LHKTIFLILVAIVFAITTIYLANESDVLNVSVSRESLTSSAQKQVECLADNIFFEAAYEPREGQVAVAVVTFNRVNSHHFAKDICGVVKEKSTRVCQFSWYCQDRERAASYNKEKYLTENQKEVYNNIYNLALYLYVNSNRIVDNTGGALYYHADYVKPNWRHLNRTVKIGRHIFYKPGDVNGKYDAKTKFGTEGRYNVAFVFPSNGRY